MGFGKAHISLSPSLPCREKTNQGRAAVCVGDLGVHRQGTETRSKVPTLVAVHFWHLVYVCL